MIRAKKQMQKDSRRNNDHMSKSRMRWEILSSRGKNVSNAWHTSSRSEKDIWKKYIWESQLCQAFLNSKRLRAWSKGKKRKKKSYPPNLRPNNLLEIAVARDCHRVTSLQIFQLLLFGSQRSIGHARCEEEAREPPVCVSNVICNTQKRTAWRCKKVLEPHSWIRIVTRSHLSEIDLLGRLWTCPSLFSFRRSIPPQTQVLHTRASCFPSDQRPRTCPDHSHSSCKTARPEDLQHV